MNNEHKASVVSLRLSDDVNKMKNKALTTSSAWLSSSSSLLSKSSSRSFTTWRSENKSEAVVQESFSS